MAHRLRCELIGMHVEESELLRLANLPVARQISLLSGKVSSPQGRAMELDMQAQRVLIRNDFVSHMHRAKLTWSFRVERGRVAAALLSAASGMDLLVVGKAGRSVVAGRRLGSVPRGILSGEHGLVLVVAHGARLRGPLVVVYDGSSAAQAGLMLAAGLTDWHDGHIEVLLVADRPETIAELKQGALGSLARLGALARCSTLIMPGVPSMVRAVESTGRGTVVLPAGGGFFHREMLLSVLDRLENAVFVVQGVDRT